MTSQWMEWKEKERLAAVVFQSLLILLLHF